MRISSLMTALLVAAAFAGCLAGTSDEGQQPTETATGTSSDSSTGSAPRGSSGSHASAGPTYDAYLEASPTNGTAPLNVTLTFGATWQDNGQHNGQQGIGTGSSPSQPSPAPASNGTGHHTGNQTGGPSGNQTGGPSGNQTDPSGNETDPSGNETGSGAHPVNGGHDVNWTLEVRLVSDGSSGNASNGTAPSNGTAQGNATGNQTGNGTSSSSTTGTFDGQTGNETGSGALVASFNGTGDDLPGNETLVLNETGSYTVTFVVTPDDGSDPIVRTADISVETLPPGSPLGNETKTFEGSFTESDPLLCMGSEDFDWVLNATYGSTPADISMVNATLDSSGFDLEGVELTLVAPNGTELASGEEINLAGPLENGTYVLRAESCAGAGVDYTITAIAQYVTKGRFA